MSQQIRLLGLVTGEQLIAKSELVDGFWNLKNTSIIVPMGKGELGLAPWLPYSTIDETGIAVRETSVMYAVEPKIELSNQYSTMFGSGIIVPDKSVSAPKLSLVQ